MISIISAFYNASAKIVKLLDSLKRQDDQDFEWIIIDDCSKEDEYKKMLEITQRSTLNIKVCRNDRNSGPGIARNNGIRLAIGDYISFVDSDDTVSDDYVKTLNNLGREKKYQIVLFDYDRVSSGKVKHCSKVDYAQTGLITKEQFLLYGKTCVCGAAFSRQLLDNGIEFPPLYRYEDWVFNVRAVLKSENIYYTKKALYFYLEEQNSLVKSGKYDAGDYAQEAYKLIKLILEKENDEIDQLIYAREILYVNAISKLGRLNLHQYAAYMNKLLENCPCNIKCSKLTVLPFHQREIIKLVLRRQYWILTLMGRLIELLKM